MHHLMDAGFAWTRRPIHRQQAHPTHSNITPMLKLLRSAAMLIFAAAMSVPAHAALGKAPAADDLFLAARDAAHNGDKAKLAKILPQLAGYPLLPYAEAWNMRLHFNELPAADISSWLDREQGNSLADRVRADWLKWLGQNQLWDQFTAEYPKLVNEDLEITCYAIAARARVDPSALDEARPYWLTTKELPESCRPLMETLMAQGAIGSEQIWARLRLLLEGGNTGAAKRVAAYLPDTEIPDPKALDRAAAKPQAWLEKPPASLASRPASELTLFALDRLARSDPQQAAALWEHKLQQRFSPADRAYGWARLGYHAARHHDPDALTWFAEAGNSALSDELLAWKARAALRAGNWAGVNDIVEHMPAILARDPAWIYWRGRALKALGKTVEAKAQFAQISKEFHFYGQLAAEEIGAPLAVPPPAPAPDARTIAAVADLVAIQRSLALYKLGMRAEGSREWQWGIRNMDDANLLAAATIANREQLYDRAINSAEKTQAQHDFSLRYLMPFSDVLPDQTRTLGLDTAWVYGLIRQESRFVFDAKSAVGARGLMQLMPATARWMAKRIGMGPHSLSDVTRTDINIVLGTNYLKRLEDDLGHPVLASAAYNAGPGRARRWRDTRALEGAIYAETIPLDETRDYVKKVMSNAAWYAALITKEPQSLKARLGTIGARGAGESVNEDLP
jgi:soluble lytic murein transglycosylase